MRNKMKRFLGIVLAIAMVVSMLTPVESSAAAKPKLSATKATLYSGYTKKLTLKNNKNKITWSSSNKKVATVDTKGTVTAVDKGTATIKATVKATKKSYTCKVTVKRKSFSLYNSMEIWSGMPETAKGCSHYENSKLCPMLEKQLGDKLSINTTWSTSDESIVWVQKNYKKRLIAIGFGKVTLKAKSGKKTYVYDVKVTDVNPYQLTDKDFDVVKISGECYNFMKDRQENTCFRINYIENQTLKTVRGIKLGSTLEEVYDMYGIEATMDAKNNHEITAYNDELHKATEWVMYHNPNHERKDCHSLGFIFDQNGEVMQILYSVHDYKWHAKKE